MPTLTVWITEDSLVIRPQVVRLLSAEDMKKGNTKILLHDVEQTLEFAGYDNGDKCRTFKSGAQVWQHICETKWEAKEKTSIPQILIFDNDIEDQILGSKFAYLCSLTATELQEEMDLASKPIPESNVMSEKDFAYAQKKEPSQSYIALLTSLKKMQEMRTELKLPMQILLFTDKTGRFIEISDHVKETLMKKNALYVPGKIGKEILPTLGKSLHFKVAVKAEANPKKLIKNKNSTTPSTGKKTPKTPFTGKRSAETPSPHESLTSPITPLPSPTSQSQSPMSGENFTTSGSGYSMFSPTQQEPRGSFTTSRSGYSSMFSFSPTQQEPRGSFTLRPIPESASQKIELSINHNLRLLSIPPSLSSPLSDLSSVLLSSPPTTDLTPTTHKISSTGSKKRTIPSPIEDLVKSPSLK